MRDHDVIHLTALGKNAAKQCVDIVVRWLISTQLLIVDYKPDSSVGNASSISCRHSGENNHHGLQSSGRRRA